MKLKKITCAAMAAAVAVSTGSLTLPLSPVAAATASATVVRLDPSNASPFNDGRFEGWGTALCWWANRLGYSEELTNQAAELFFSDEGLSLDIARYNIGGGDNPSHNHITRSDSAVPGYWASYELTNGGKDVNITYDWTKDENQRNIALAALKANPDLYFEGFSNSPPYFMTNSGCSSGAANANNDNLKSDMYDDFAKYIADTTKHFKDEFGIEFKSYSPMNEPDTDYWGANSYKQEGCHYSPGNTQSTMIIETRKALDAAGLNDVLVAGMDETSIDKSVANLDKLSADAKAALGRIDTHTYGGSQRTQLRAKAISLGKNLWMSEVDDGSNGFWLAQRIIDDLNGMQASAWVMWDIIDVHKDSKFKDPSGNYTEKNASLNVTGGLWGVGMANHDNQKIELSNKYYAFGQFTRYINPGDTLIPSSGSTLAAYNRDNGDIKIVVNNSSSRDVPYEFDLSAFRTVGNEITEIRSDNSVGDDAEHWAEITGEASLENKILKTTAKGGTITTYIISGAEDFKDEYAMINGGDSGILIGGTSDLTLATNISGTPVWSVDDANIAAITQDGKLTINKPGTVTVMAQIGGYTAVKTIEAMPAITADKAPIKAGDKINLSTNTASGYTGEITWSVDKPEIADITSGGVLTFKSTGMVTVTVTVAGVSASRAFAISKYTLSGTASWGSSDPDDNTDYRKVADGNLKTAFDGATNGWVMYDFGEPYKVSEIQLAARSGFEPRTTGGTVQVSNDAITWTDLYTLKAQIPSTSYTILDADELGIDGAYRYYRYINTLAETNISEFLIVGEPSDDIPEGDPTIYDIPEFTDDFEGSENIFGAGTGTLSGNGNQIYASGLNRFGNVFVPVKATGTSALENAIELESNQKFRMKLNIFAGWEGSGKDNTFAINDADGNELIALYFTGGGYNLNQLRIGGKNVLNGTPTAQCKTSASGGANNWGHASQPYRNYVGYNKDLEIIIDGTGSVKVSFTGGLENTIADGAIDVSEKPVTIGSIALTGDYNSNRGCVVSYDNLDGDIITYSDELDPPPVLPDDGTLISLDFDNGDLTSGSSYGKAEGTPKFVEVDGRKAVQFNGTAATAIKLTNANGGSLLAGQDEITVSFSVKQTDGSTSWWFYAAPNDNAQTYQKEYYIGALGKSGALSVERYNNGRSATSDGAFTLNEWHDVIISFSESETTLYIDGEKKATTASAFKINNMLGSNPVAYIGRANWGSGEYAVGYIDNFVIKKGTYSTVLDGIDLGDTSAVKSDIAIPEIEGVTWTSSNEAVVGIDGKVTRQDETVTVTLTAENNGDTRNFTVTVIGLTAFADTFTAYYEDGAIKFTLEEDEDCPYDYIVALHSEDGLLEGVSINKPSGSFDGISNGAYEADLYIWDNMTPKHNKAAKIVNVKDEIKTDAYLFAHFVDTQEDATREQIYFSVSKDGQTWTTLNNKKPVLTSNVGEKGVRDPYILRGEDGKFFVIATDLSIYYGKNDWGRAAQRGSKSIVVWESDDLVNWSEASLVKINGDNAGCTWAPEAVYDPEKGEYMVFWASVISDDGYSKYRIYRSYTADFKEFSEPELYIEEPNAVIDTTIIDHKGVYYRFTKNEARSAITMQQCTSLSGDWKDVATYNLGDMTGYEGPAIYKLNGEDKWCLLLDLYSQSKGYKPFVTDDITKGVFTSAADFTFDGTYRHGTVMPITQAEYDALVKAY
ncbi:MAG: discoidin domain-containing protein [Oscillospiraceae bacterium]|nr:discoidin domain-containing protein [Oscillospiraceae bacterium]